MQSNFEFLQVHDLRLFRFAYLAEKYYRDDPNTSLIKLRQFGELITQLIAQKNGIIVDELDHDNQKLQKLITQLKEDNIIDPEIAELLHKLRRNGNMAIHRFLAPTSESENHLRDKVLKNLRRSYNIAIWFHKKFTQETKKNKVKFPELILPTYSDQEIQTHLENQIEILQQERKNIQLDIKKALEINQNLNDQIKKLSDERDFATIHSQNLTRNLTQTQEFYEQQMIVLKRENHALHLEIKQQRRQPNFQEEMKELQERLQQEKIRCQSLNREVNRNKNLLKFLKISVLMTATSVTIVLGVSIGLISGILSPKPISHSPSLEQTN